MTDEKRVEDLEKRIDELESTVGSMLPSRRDALKLGVAGVAGAAAMSGTVSAGSAQVGTIGDSNNLVDVEAEDINVSDTINGASVSGAAGGEALTSDGAGGLTFASVGGGVPPDFSYNDVTNGREFDTVYTNTTGSALYVIAQGDGDFNSAIKRLTAYVDGQQIKRNYFRLTGTNWQEFTDMSIDFFVPDGATYEVQEFELEQVEIWVEAEM